MKITSLIIDPISKYIKTKPSFFTPVKPNKLTKLHWLDLRQFWTFFPTFFWRKNSSLKNEKTNILVTKLALNKTLKIRRNKKVDLYFRNHHQKKIEKLSKCLKDTFQLRSSVAWNKMFVNVFLLKKNVF